jgi:hypothetical protein
MASSSTALVSQVVWEQSSEWPLLVLDASEFLAWCRSCAWKSPCVSTPDVALAAFAAHTCEGGA